MPALVRRERAPRGGPTARRVRAWAEGMLRALGAADAELSVLLTGDAFIRELNRDYRRKDRPTDVLAFAAREADVDAVPPARLPSAAPVLGDVVISLETAARQATERGRPLADEVLHLLAHGVLHLFGDDHRTRAEERRMDARADLLRAAALGAVVTGSTPGGAGRRASPRLASRAVDMSVAGKARRQSPRTPSGRRGLKKPMISVIYWVSSAGGALGVRVVTREVPACGWAVENGALSRSARCGL